MNIEEDIFDAEAVVKEAEEMVENPTRETALDAYFSILGNCPKITQKQQIQMAADYHAAVKSCETVLDKIPGKMFFLSQALQQILDGERLENFIVSDAKEVKKYEFFKSLQENSALNYPNLAEWRIRPTLLLRWSREIIQMHQKIPQRPWVSKITPNTKMPANKQAMDDLQRWYNSKDELEKITLLPIDQLSFYVSELKKHAARAEEIFTTLIEANLKLVVALAKRYQKRGLDMDDLIQEGNMGLMKGIERFQAAKGFNVSTYVVWWIRQSLTKALMTQGHIIRYPPAVHDLMRKVRREMEEAQKAGKPEPTTARLAAKLETSEQNIEIVLSMFQVVSLNQPAGDGEETLENIIPGEEGVTFQEGEELREAIETLLQTLKPNERRVLKLRFGLPGSVADAINEIGADFKIIRSGARQIEAKALAKLRKSARIQIQKTRFC